MKLNEIRIQKSKILNRRISGQKLCGDLVATLGNFDVENGDFRGGKDAVKQCLTY